MIWNLPLKSIEFTDQVMIEGDTAYPHFTYRYFLLNTIFSYIMYSYIFRNKILYICPKIPTLFCRPPCWEPNV